MNIKSLTTAFIFGVSLTACDAQKAETPATKSPESNTTQQKADPETLSRMNWVLESTRQAQQINFGLGESVMKLPQTQNALGFRILLGDYSSAWGKLNGIFAGLFRLEQLLSTTTATKEQRDIIAYHYSYLAVEANILSIYPNMPRLKELSPSDTKFFNELTETGGKISVTAWAYCKLLSPDVAASVMKEAQVPLGIMKSVEQRTTGIIEGYEQIKALHEAQLKQLKDAKSK